MIRVDGAASPAAMMVGLAMSQPELIALAHTASPAREPTESLERVQRTLPQRLSHARWTQHCERCYCCCCCLEAAKRESDWATVLASDYLVSAVVSRMACPRRPGCCVFAVVEEIRCVQSRQWRPRQKVIIHTLKQRLARLRQLLQRSATVSPSFSALL